MACSCSYDFLSNGEADASLAAAADEFIKVRAGMSSQLACASASSDPSWLPRKIAPKQCFPQEFQPDWEHSLPEDSSKCREALLVGKHPATASNAQMASDGVDANLQLGDPSGDG